MYSILSIQTICSHYTLSFQTICSYVFHSVLSDKNVPIPFCPFRQYVPMYSILSFQTICSHSILSFQTICSHSIPSSCLSLSIPYLFILSIPAGPQYIGPYKYIFSSSGSVTSEEPPTLRHQLIYTEGCCSSKGGCRPVATPPPLIFIFTA